MTARMCCAKCGAGLVPAWTGLKCPRGSACGYGGVEETSLSLRPSHLRAPSGRSGATA